MNKYYFGISWTDNIITKPVFLDCIDNIEQETIVYGSGMHLLYTNREINWHENMTHEDLLEFLKQKDK